MGQALRRATGKVRPDHPARPPIKKPERPPPSPTAAAQARPPDAPAVGQDRLGISDAEVTEGDKDSHGVLEERDPKYDEMLQQMAGRITSRPGGKLEMGEEMRVREQSSSITLGFGKLKKGEAFIVERYNRPMPKLRSSKAEAGGSMQKPLPPGTLTIDQVRQIILLHQGKSDEHQGPMDINDIANKFRVDATHVQRMVQFMSLPPEDSSGKSEQ